MPRGRRRATQDVNSLQEELNALKARQAELRQQIRRMKNGGTEVRKLQEKLSKQLANAKWTVGMIQQIDPNWDDVGFYGTVQAKKPTPRGRRPRAAEAAG